MLSQTLAQGQNVKNSTPPSIKMHVLKFVFLVPSETVLFQNLFLLRNASLKTFCRQHDKNRCIELPKEESKEGTETKQTFNC